MENVNEIVARHDEQLNSHEDRLTKVEKRQDNLDKLVNSVSIMATEQEHMKGDVTEIKADVKQLTMKSGKRFDDLLDKLLWLLIGGAVVYLVYQISGGAVTL